HLGAALYRALKVFPLQLPDHLLLVHIFLGQAELDGFPQNVIIVVDVHHQVGAVLPGQANALIVDQAGVLNGIDAREDRVLDTLRAVRMRGDLAPSHVRLFRGGFQFLRGKLRRARTVTLGEHSARSQYLDYVDSVFHLRAHHVPDLVNAVSNLKIALLGKHRHARLRGIIVQVAVTAGDGNAGTAGHDPRTGNQSFVDRISQIDGKERLGADVAHAGKAGVQGLARVHHRGKRRLKRRVLEAIDFVVAVGARTQVGVTVDQPGKNRGAREIDHGCGGWNGHTRGRTHGLDPVARHHDHHVLADIA